VKIALRTIKVDVAPRPLLTYTNPYAGVPAALMAKMVEISQAIDASFISAHSGSKLIGELAKAVVSDPMARADRDVLMASWLAFKEYLKP
jgi:hypothetical protein